MRVLPPVEEEIRRIVRALRTKDPLITVSGLGARAGTLPTACSSSVRATRRLCGRNGAISNARDGAVILTDVRVPRVAASFASTNKEIGTSAAPSTGPSYRGADALLKQRISIPSDAASKLSNGSPEDGLTPGGSRVQAWISPVRVLRRHTDDASAEI